MSYQSCIKHPKRDRFVSRHKDYLAIADGSDCAAELLALFEFWTTCRLIEIDRAKRENAAAIREGSKPIHETSLWLYESLESIQEGLLGGYSRNIVRKSLDTLVDKQFLDRRNNPKLKWDKTYQYLFNIDFVQSAVDGWAIALERTEKTIVQNEAPDESDLTHRGSDLNLHESDLNFQGSEMIDDLYSLNSTLKSPLLEKEEKSASFSSEGQKQEQTPPVSGSASTNSTLEAVETPHPPTPRSPRSAASEYKHPGKGVNDRFSNPECSQNPYYDLLGEYELDHLWVGDRRSQLNKWHPALLQVCKKHKQVIKQADDQGSVLTYLTNLMKQARLDISVIATIQRHAAEAGLYDLVSCAAIHRPVNETEQQALANSSPTLPAGFEEWWELAYKLGKVREYATEGFREPNITNSFGKRYSWSLMQTVLPIDEMKTELQQRGQAA